VWRRPRLTRACSRQAEVGLALRTHAALQEAK
jgi:hypothetical protein